MYVLVYTANLNFCTDVLSKTNRGLHFSKHTPEIKDVFVYGSSAVKSLSTTLWYAKYLMPIYVQQRAIYSKQGWLSLNHCIVHLCFVICNRFSATTAEMVLKVFLKNVDMHA